MEPKHDNPVVEDLLETIERTLKDRGDVDAVGRVDGEDAVVGVDVGDHSYFIEVTEA